jgi:CheY-like chemotaxis protein
MPTILIVDDNEDNRDLYSMILDHLGLPIVLAVDGLEAVERARELKPVVILMDLAMPNMDGFEATRQIRELPCVDTKAVPIIAITAFTDAVSAQRALAAGANEVLTKPCPPSQLSARVEAAIQAQRASRSA